MTKRELTTDSAIKRRTLLKAGAGAAALATSLVAMPRILRAADKVKVGFLTAFTGLETILG